MTPPGGVRAQLERVLRASLAAVDSRAAVSRAVVRAGGGLAICGSPLAENRRLWVLAVGKAAAAMAAAFEALAGDRIAGGLAITKDGYGVPLERIALREAGHPVPDARSEAASREALALVDGAGRDEALVVLLSGGASSLLACPSPGLALADVAATTSLLLSAGAGIEELNAVRKHLSAVGGGRLGRRAVSAQIEVIVAALANMGVYTASFIAVLGAAGLAVGLALQGSLANFASGVLMLIFKPIRVGDFVEAGGAKGTVKEIGIFTTILNSPDNIRIIVPNSQVTGSNVSNYTANGTRRVDMVIGVSYEDDLKKARQVIEKVLAGDDRILSDPAPTVAVSELADSSVNFVVRPWTKAADYWDVRFDTIAKIKVALDKSGITIPFPQRDIHIKDGNLPS